jgi:hypothetical protein
MKCGQELFERGPARQVLLEGETRRESGEDNHEFAEQLKREFQPAKKTMSAAFIN